MLEIQPITFSEAAEYIRAHHRHHIPPVGWLFGCAVNNGEEVVGVVTIGRPVARVYDDGYTAEVTRCCTDGTRNACSMLYGASWRAAKALGYRKLITYTRTNESGSSLKAAGWRVVGERKARSWAADSNARPRVDKSDPFQRMLWEAM